MSNSRSKCSIGTNGTARRLREGLWLVAIGVIVSVPSFVACGSSHTPPPKTADSSIDLLRGAGAADDASQCEYKGRLDREAKESAGLGSIRPNIRRVYAIVGEGDERRRVLLCREVDTNLDGRKDVIRTFNDKGESLRELADSDYDGKIDTWLTFARGHMAKVEIDGNRDGNADEFRFYVKGKLARMQRDSNHDARPDIWEIYEDGELRRIGYDIDFDGHVDRWDRDEVAERAALERELQEEEKRKREQAAGADGQPTGAGGTPSKSEGATKTGDGATQSPNKEGEPAKEPVGPRNP